MINEELLRQTKVGGMVHIRLPNINGRQDIYRPVILEVFESEDGCSGCFFERGRYSVCGNDAPCHHTVRPDKRDVIFSKVAG